MDFAMLHTLCFSLLGRRSIHLLQENFGITPPTEGNRFRFSLLRWLPRYLNLDDCWAKGRSEDGSLLADKAAVAGGLWRSGRFWGQNRKKGGKTLGTLVVSKGVCLGVYQGTGVLSCLAKVAISDFRQTCLSYFFTCHCTIVCCCMKPVLYCSS